jgi:hypothetical protein
LMSDRPTPPAWRTMTLPCLSLFVPVPFVRGDGDGRRPRVASVAHSAPATTAEGCSPSPAASLTSASHCSRRVSRSSRGENATAMAISTRAPRFTS